MVSKKNFQQNGRPMHQQRTGPYNKKPFKPAGGGPPNNFNQMMFNASQIPENPGFMDFNNPTPPMHAAQPQGDAVAAQQKKKNNKNKQKNKQVQPPQQQQQQPQQQQNGNWNNNKNKNIQHQLGRNAAAGGPNKRFNNIGRGFNPNLVGPPNLRGRRLPPPHMPMMPPHNFQPPMISPIGMPPMGRAPMLPVQPPPPPFLRRSARIPIPPPPMMGPPRHMARPLPPIPFNGAGKIKKPNPKIVKKVVKGKSTIKTLKNLVNQYPIDKPWVTAEIRTEHDKKIDIENRLKGNKDDELFAQFKTQRDKFVALYETAREEYLKQEAAAVKAKDAKDKQTNNTKTAAKDGNSKEAITNNTK